MVARKSRVAVVDYSLGNLFSVMLACERAGLHATVTSNREEVCAADAVILPGVGAFGDAMENLRRLDLVSVLHDIAQSDKLLIGICLGQQLLMSESFEFGRHKGLGILEGEVVRFEQPNGQCSAIKVPQVGWNRIYEPPNRVQAAGDGWANTPLAGIQAGEPMYFVHSYYVRPTNPAMVLATTNYGHIEFCSSVQRDNVIGFQFHPERSGPAGMQIYTNLAAIIRTQIELNGVTRHAA